MKQRDLAPAIGLNPVVNHQFNRFTGITEERVEAMKKAASELTLEKGQVEMRHILYLAFIGFSVTALAIWLAGMIPPMGAVLTTNTYKVLLVTVFGLGLSFTPASRIPV